MAASDTSATNEGSSASSEATQTDDEVIQMTHTLELSAAAAELYRLASGVDLTSAQAADLAAMLTVDDTGKWVNRTYHTKTASTAVLDARALAGLLILDENIVWSVSRALTARESYERLARLLRNTPGAGELVRRFSAATGGQRIELVSGKRLIFAIGIHGARGLSADCNIVEEAFGDPGRMDHARISGASRPNPQVVASA